MKYSPPTEREYARFFGEELIEELIQLDEELKIAQLSRKADLDGPSFSDIADRLMRTEFSE